MFIMPLQFCGTAGGKVHSGIFAGLNRSDATWLQMFQRRFHGWKSSLLSHVYCHRQAQFQIFFFFFSDSSLVSHRRQRSSLFFCPIYAQSQTVTLVSHQHRCEYEMNKKFSKRFSSSVCFSDSLDTVLFLVLCNGNKKKPTINIFFFSKWFPATEQK